MSFICAKYYKNRMDPYHLLKPFCPVPVTHQNLVPLLKGYKRPNDKISNWLDKGYLIPLSKGIYCISEDICGSKPSAILVANILYGPSYVSLEYALAHYQAIPESVEEVSSVTTKRGKTVETAMGRFSYTHLPLPYYSYGIGLKQLENGQYALMASPEKTLFDTVVCTRKLLFRSAKDARHWMADMRLDESWLDSLNQKLMARWIGSAPKKESLRHLLNSMEAYVA